MDLQKYCFKTSLGYFTAISTNHQLLRLNYEESTEKETDSELLYNVEQQIKEYINGKRKIFKIDYLLQGTEFQKSVWLALAEIPYGAVVSYEDIAIKIGRPKALRAVGSAVGANPLPLILPCHRVIRKNGEIGQFGLGVDMKLKLLKIEKYN